MKYVVTGINKLTGERMAITSPRALKDARELRNHLARKLHCRSVYKHLEVEPEDKQLQLFQCIL